MNPSVELQAQEAGGTKAIVQPTPSGLSSLVYERVRHPLMENENPEKATKRLRVLENMNTVRRAINTLGFTPENFSGDKEEALSVAALSFETGLNPEEISYVIKQIVSELIAKWTVLGPVGKVNYISNSDRWMTITEELIEQIRRDASTGASSLPIHNVMIRELAEMIGVSEKELKKILEQAFIHRDPKGNPTLYTRGIDEE